MKDLLWLALHRMLLAACTFFALFGVAVALFGGGLLSPWRSAMSAALGLGVALPTEISEFVRLTEGILGASIAGKWVATAWLVHEPIRRRERWALYALLASHGTWFIVDSIGSALYGAPANIVLINLFPFLFVTLLAARLIPMARAVPRKRGPFPTAGTALLAVCALSIGTGVASAFLIGSPLFDMYNAGIADTFFDGQMPPDAVVWQRFVYALIGGTIAGHFVALTGALWFDRTARWALSAVLTSMLVWFVVDTAVSFRVGAHFNIWLVNVPSLVAVSAPLLFALGSRPKES